MSNHPIVLVALLLPTTAGCMPDIEEEAATAMVQAALQSAEQQSSARNVAEAAPDDCAMTAEELALEAVAAPVVGLYPPSCVEKRADGVRVHAEYEHCNTLFGTSDLSGGIDSTIESTGACTLRADVTDSGNFTDHGKPYTYAASVDVTVRPAERDIQWADHWQGTTVKDQAIEQSGNWHIVYHLETGCYDFEGPAQGTLDDTPYDFAIADLSICEGECPSRGTAVVNWDDSLEMTVEFDGSDVAKVTGWSGREFEVEMICEPTATP